MQSNARLLIALLGIAAAATLTAQQLTDAQRSAIKSACRGDYQNVCASVAPGTKEALQCLVQHNQQVSPGCRDALAPATATASAAPASGAAPAATAGSATGAASASGAASAPGGVPAPRLSPREEAHVLRSQCGADFQKLCPSVPLGGGRGVGCLRAHAADLTPGCRQALMSAAQQ